jgi:hypothetical protein
MLGMVGTFTWRNRCHLTCVLLVTHSSHISTCLKSCEMTKGTQLNGARGVSHCGLAIYITKYLKAKSEL